MGPKRKQYAIEIIEDEEFEQVIDKQLLLFIRDEWDLMYEWILMAAAHIDIPYPDISLWHLSIKADHEFDG